MHPTHTPDSKLNMLHFQHPAPALQSTYHEEHALSPSSPDVSFNFSSTGFNSGIHLLHPASGKIPEAQTTPTTCIIPIKDQSTTNINPPVRYTLSSPLSALSIQCLNWSLWHGQGGLDGNQSFAVAAAQVLGANCGTRVNLPIRGRVTRRPECIRKSMKYGRHNDNTPSSILCMRFRIFRGPFMKRSRIRKSVIGYWYRQIWRRRSWEMGVSGLESMVKFSSCF
jgi:hypothetical protein